jgi:hypothetical protein
MTIDVIEYKAAIFRQVNKVKPHTDHDALEFPNGLADGLEEFFSFQQSAARPRRARRQPRRGAKFG